ncbi:SirB2 family protein [Parachitinimonas caeni]|uniref:SirB2 family protein n=1 Tax=Parachitinimonas caeni TaxID=3031301 RepID=A0ABT7DTW2_9NEIS|nr:SirB2 family protein [Parachitinimonas caeni]MDK2123514.1 SirB2 family protein [Parachitinimonas caeni]
MPYVALKHLHMTAAALSLLLFLLRGAWMLTDNPRLQARWVKIVPHINDTVLLAAAISMAVSFGFNPLAQSWLMAKILALLVYIVLGTIALKRGKTRQIRLTAFVGALMCFGYIVLVALSKSPMPFLG